MSQNRSFENNGNLKESQFKVPILFLAYNRPKETKIVFNKIKSQKPAHLYLSVDGPREDIRGDFERCKKVKSIVTNVDWECDLNILFRDKNLGVKKAVSEAITWFFSDVEEGIILEDDCVPSESFFPYCELLLDWYRNDDRIMMISGFNKRGKWNPEKYDYFFSHLGGIWGWATWRKAWDKFDIDMKGLDDVIRKGELRSLLGEETGKIREQQFISAMKGDVETWDYQWGFSRNINHGLSIVPSKNLVTNIGFGDDATHTKKGQEYDFPSYELSLPIDKNNVVIPDREYDNLFFEKDTFMKRITHKIKQYFLPANLNS